MPKIMHLIEYFNVAGAENVVKSIALKTKSETIDIEVTVLNAVGINGDVLNQKGIIVRGLESKKNKKGFFKIVLDLYKILKYSKVDVLHAHNFTPWFYSVFAKFVYRSKLIVTLHGIFENKNSILKKAMLRFMVRYTDKIVCVSQEIENELLSKAPNANKKTKLIFNGINLQKFSIQVDKQAVRKELGVNTSDFLLVTLSRFYQIKNIERQIELLSNLVSTEKNIKLLIAARYIPYAETIKEYSKRLCVQDHVFFLGLRHDIPQILKASDVFVLSSFSEGTSLALIEAIAAGLPAVVSNVGGNPNLVKHGINGYLFDLNKQYDFENKILELHNYPDILQRFSQNQHNVALKYSEEHMINGYREIYTNL